MKGLLYFFLFFIASCGKGSETINSVSNEEVSSEFFVIGAEGEIIFIIL